MPNNFRTGNWTLRVEPDGVSARLWFCGTAKSEPLPYDDEDQINAANALLLKLRKGQQKTPVPVP